MQGSQDAEHGREVVDADVGEVEGDQAGQVTQACQLLQLDPAHAQTQMRQPMQRADQFGDHRAVAHRRGEELQVVQDQAAQVGAGQLVVVLILGARPAVHLGAHAVDVLHAVAVLGLDEVVNSVCRRLLLQAQQAQGLDLFDDGQAAPDAGHGQLRERLPGQHLQSHHQGMVGHKAEVQSTQASGLVVRKNGQFFICQFLRFFLLFNQDGEEAITDGLWQVNSRTYVVARCDFWIDAGTPTEIGTNVHSAVWHNVNTIILS